jgi:hypothetical protein
MSDPGLISRHVLCNPFQRVKTNPPKIRLLPSHDTNIALRPGPVLQDGSSNDEIAFPSPRGAAETTASSETDHGSREGGYRAAFGEGPLLAEVRKVPPSRTRLP